MTGKVRIYTRQGDKGQTSLFGGRRVSKGEQKLHAYGSLDELNSLIGVVLGYIDDELIREEVKEVQKDIFFISSVLAGAKVRTEKLSLRVSQIEKLIDKLDEQLPSLRNFILPGGTQAASWFFFIRAVSRRAEREIVKLSQKHVVAGEILVYINRISDLFFVLSRHLNNKKGLKETIWIDK